MYDMAKFSGIISRILFNNNLFKVKPQSRRQRSHRNNMKLSLYRYARKQSLAFPDFEIRNLNP